VGFWLDSELDKPMIFFVFHNMVNPILQFIFLHYPRQEEWMDRLNVNNT
jgi:hypothetical protein